MVFKFIVKKKRIDICIIFDINFIIEYKKKLWKYVYNLDIIKK